MLGRSLIQGTGYIFSSPDPCPFLESCRPASPPDIYTIPGPPFFFPSDLPQCVNFVQTRVISCSGPPSNAGAKRRAPYLVLFSVNSLESSPRFFSLVHPFSCVALCFLPRLSSVRLLVENPPFISRFVAWFISPHLFSPPARFFQLRKNFFPGR